MKKKNLKSLNLNKTSISSFQKDIISGGTATGGGTIGTLCALYSNIIECGSRTCISTAQATEEIKPTCFNCGEQ